MAMGNPVFLRKSKQAITAAMHRSGQIRHKEPDVYDALGGSAY